MVLSTFVITNFAVKMIAEILESLPRGIRLIVEILVQRAQVYFSRL